MPAGRPTKFKPEYVDQAYNYCLLGATDIEMATFFDVDEKTLNVWKHKHPEFRQSLKDGKQNADANVGKALYQRATGYSHKEDKIFQHEGEPIIVPTTKHYPPDATSMIFWLKNRQSGKWRDRQEYDVNLAAKVTFNMDFGNKAETADE